MKGLKAEPSGVLFHHFLEMTTESRWRFFQQTVQCHNNEINCRTFHKVHVLLLLLPQGFTLFPTSITGGMTRVTGFVEVITLKKYILQENQLLLKIFFFFLQFLNLQIKALQKW